MTDYPEAFVFCWYPDGWTPRAVIADISKLDDFTKDQMSKMLSVGNIVESVTEKFDCRYDDQGNLKGFSSKVLGYRSSTNDTVVDDKEINACFSTWLSLSDGFRIKKNSPEWMQFASEYYINDKNYNLSPIKLHAKLLSLTCNPQSPEHKFTVKHCVLLSDIPLTDDDDEVKPLRFFIKLKDDNLTSSDVKDKLMETFDADNVMLSSADYGYLTPKTIEKWEELDKNAFDFEFGVIIFA